MEKSRIDSKLEKTERQVSVFVLTGFFWGFFAMIYSVSVKFETSWENENKKSSKNPANMKTDTCCSVFSNFKPILMKLNWITYVGK